MDKQDKIHALEERLVKLQNELSGFTKEISWIQQELQEIKGKSSSINHEDETPYTKKQVSLDPHDKIKFPKETSVKKPAEAHRPPEKAVKHFSVIDKKSSKSNRDLESYFGKSIISVIGIIAVLIGLSILGKYAYEQVYFGFKWRLVLGYTAGAMLTGIAFQLIRKYDKYSALLMGGGMAVLYFNTYFGYDFYNLIPQIPAFIIMVLITLFTALSATKYKRQEIGLYGMLLAYAVPFLLGGEESQPAILFSYILLINIGILFLTYRFQWQLLFHLSFYVSWILFLGWYLIHYSPRNDQLTALVFSASYFTIYTGYFLITAISKRKKITGYTIAIIFANSLFFFITFQSIIIYHDLSHEGLCSALYSLLILGAGLAFRKKIHLAARDALFALSIFYFTLAIAFEFEGASLLVVWATEAIALFFLAKKQGLRFLGWFAMTVYLLSIIALLGQWSNYYLSDLHFLESNYHIFWNKTFWGTLYFLLATSAIRQIGFNRKEDRNSTYYIFLTLLWSAFPVIIYSCLFLPFYFEIKHGWQNVFSGNLPEWRSQLLGIYSDYTLLLFFTLFQAGFSFLTTRFWPGKKYLYVAFILLAIAFLSNLSYGMVLIAQFRDFYYTEGHGQFIITLFSYFHFLLAGGILLLLYGILKARNRPIDATLLWQYTVPILVLIFFVYELTNWYIWIEGYSQTTLLISLRLGLTVLFSIYSLLLVVLGFFKNVAIWRWFGLTLFFISLVKLILFDLNNINVLQKVLGFVAIGMLMLLVSYLYFRFQEKIPRTDDAENLKKN